MAKYYILIPFVFFSISACAELKSVHPDESALQTYERRLSTSNAIESLSSIDSALTSFTKLTLRVKKSNINIESYPNTDWECQNIGFPNMVSAIKGTLLKQDYLIKKYKYEKSSKSGQLSKIYQEYKTAEKKFLDFWKSLEIVD